MPIFGVDVSHHQGPELDWGKIRDSGIEFMFARASLADIPDKRYERNHRRAKEAGIPVLGAYHFLYPASVVPPAQQAQLFVDQIGDRSGIMTMLDVERDNDNRPKIKAVREFAKAFADLTDGHPLLLYAPAWYWGIIDNPPAADLGALVASHYVAVDRNAEGHRVKMTPAEAFARARRRYWRASHGGWTHATILQFTSFGKVAGHDGRIDVNAFRGTTQELATLAIPGAAPLVPPDDGPDDEPDDPEDDDADEGLGHGSSDASDKTGQFHRVVKGDTLFAIAIAAGFHPKGGKPAFQVMIDAFPENERFRANPGSIDPGDRVRIR